ncbi:MAG: GNAT family N-acetyltransferase [Acetobacteraceae bacterium]
MANVIIRPAIRADLPAIIALLAADDLGRNRERPADTVDPRYEAAFAAIEADPHQLQVVAESEGRVIGCLQLSFIPGLSRLGAWRGQVEGVRVAADQRSAGVGRMMMLWAIEQCRARGCEVVQLTTDRRRADAHRFYGSLGFEASHVGMKKMLV